MTPVNWLEISVSSEQQLFNSMDPAPFRSRELDPAVVEYIIAHAEQAPGNAELGVSIRIETPPPGAETIIAAAIAENFRRKAATIRRDLRRLFHDGRISLVIGIAFVGLAVAIGEALAGVAPIISESFVIGSWVALWHPINIFLFDWWPLRRQARLYDRLSAMQVRVI